MIKNKKINMKIIPAVLEKNFSEIEKKLDFLSNIKKKYNLTFDTVQIDLCDGEFVENKTWLPNIENIKEIEKIISYGDVFNIEYHIMCENQFKYILELKSLKVKRVVVHIDNLFNKKNILEFESILKYAKENYIKILITTKLDFMAKNKEKIVSFLENHKDIDLQIMGIDKIGIQGENFDERCIFLIKFFRKNFKEKDLSIQMDGAINEKNSFFVKEAGANEVVIGSYLMKNLQEEYFLKNFYKI